MGIIETPQTILIFRALQLGDLLCTVPAFRTLRTAYPNAKIALVGLPWAESFVRRFSSYLDELIPFPGWPGLPEQEPQTGQIPKFLSDIQKRKFDLAVQMQGSGYLTNPLVTLFGAKQTAGFYLPDQYCPDGQTFFPYTEGEHEIRVFLRLMQNLGLPTQGEQLEYPVTEEEQAAFRKLQTRYNLSPKSYICLHPGARDAARRWPVEKFARVGDALSQSGYQVVLTGTSEERPLTKAVASQMRFPAHDLAGKTDMGTLAVLLSCAQMLISNDTGVAHVAAALQLPSVILYNTTDPGRWGPLDRSLHRVIVNASQVDPQEVLAEADRLLKEMSVYAD